MRRVILIPAIHDISESHAEGMFEKAAEASGMPELAEAGRTFTQEVSNYVNRYWEGVEKNLAIKSLDPKKTRVYLESTYEPLEDELPHIQKGAEANSPECKLALDLFQRGMKYEPAESESAYKHHGKLLDLGNKVIFSQLRARSARVFGQREVLHGKIQNLADEEVEKRDRETASRINQTLQVNETGIVIFGQHHNIQRFLDPNIEFLSLGEAVAQEIGTLDEVIASIRHERENKTPTSEAKG